MSNDRMNEICAVCGLVYGSHKGHGPANQCPMHEGRMDWPEVATIFEPTGTYREESTDRLSDVFRLPYDQT